MLCMMCGVVPPVLFMCGIPVLLYLSYSLCGMPVLLYLSYSLCGMPVLLCGVPVLLSMCPKTSDLELNYINSNHKDC